MVNTLFLLVRDVTSQSHETLHTLLVELVTQLDLQIENIHDDLVTWGNQAFQKIVQLLHVLLVVFLSGLALEEVIDDVDLLLDFLGEILLV